MSYVSAIELEEELNETLRYMREIYNIVMDTPQQPSAKINTRLALKQDVALSEVLGITEKALGFKYEKTN
jgi:hypothetical protein